MTPDGRLVCADKFGHRVTTPSDQTHYLPTVRIAPMAGALVPGDAAHRGALRVPDLDGSGEDALVAQGRAGLERWTYEALIAWLGEMRRWARRDDRARTAALGALTTLIDRRVPAGTKKRSSVLALLHGVLYDVLRDAPDLATTPLSLLHRVDWTHRHALAGPPGNGHTLAVDAQEFPPDGPESVARLLVEPIVPGWRSFIVFDLRGHRFLGCGLGPRTRGCRIDVYGSAGDYLGSGLDGLELAVHNDAQDQVGQIPQRGSSWVIHGATFGQTLLYGAKGGDLRPRQRRGADPHQRRGTAARGHQRHGARLSGRIVHGRRSARRRRLRRSQRDRG